jgi:hypothetical protein
MYLYHIIFTYINICGIDCQKKSSSQKNMLWKTLLYIRGIVGSRPPAPMSDTRPVGLCHLIFPILSSSIHLSSRSPQTKLTRVRHPAPSNAPPSSFLGTPLLPRPPLVLLPRGAAPDPSLACRLCSFQCTAAAPPRCAPPSSFPGAPLVLLPRGAAPTPSLAHRPCSSWRAARPPPPCVEQCFVRPTHRSSSMHAPPDMLARAPPRMLHTL